MLKEIMEAFRKVLRDYDDGRYIDRADIGSVEEDLNEMFPVEYRVEIRDVE